MSHWRRVAFLVLLASSLAACGFHPRGSVPLPPELAEMALRDASPVTDVFPELRQALQNKKIHLNDAAPLTLKLVSEQYGKRVLSVNSVGRAQEYSLSYTVRFLLKKEAMPDEDGAMWLAEQGVTEARELRFSATAVLGTANEEMRLKTEMRRVAVSKILRRLQYAGPVVADINERFRTVPSPPLSSEGRGDNLPAIK